MSEVIMAKLIHASYFKGATGAKASCFVHRTAKQATPLDGHSGQLLDGKLSSKYHNINKQNKLNI